jgi:hypothetical protein
VDPNHVPVRQRLLHLGAVPAKPLRKPALPVAAPPHFQKVKWGAQTEPDQKQDVVNSPHSDRLDMS